MKIIDVILVGAVMFVVFVVLKLLLGELKLWEVGALGGASVLCGLIILKLKQR